MDRRPPQEFAGDREPELTADEIESQMRGPIQDWPSIIVVGDEDVVGYNPPRSRAES